MSEKYIIISAPSGAGKTTIVKQLLEKKELKLEFSISACSRKKRDYEINGKDYFFLSVEEFKDKISKNEFVEWEEVYENNFYGTLKKQLSDINKRGNNALFDVDVKGGVNLKNIFGNAALSVFIMPPSIEELEIRLRNRHSETEESLKKRVGKAKEELTYAEKFDIIIVNDKLDDAIEKSFYAIYNFLYK